MKKLVVKILNLFIQKAKKSKLIQSLFESPIDLNKFVVFGKFVDSNNISHNLHSGFRSKIKPGWENYVKCHGKGFDTSDDAIKANFESGRHSLDRLNPIINSFGRKIETSTILEIGCHFGAVSYLFAELGAKKVFASDFSGYKASAVDKNETSEKILNDIDNDLKTAREKLRLYYKRSENVEFYNDDICKSKLPEKNFDLIVSFDVLEHLSNPAKAFENISSLLKKDGIAIHEYNPFFSLNGGHSACTLDFPWGHVRLSEKDFERYISEIRPSEEILAKSFYYEGLNRMCLYDLYKYSYDNGLKILSVIQFTKEQHVRSLNGEIFEQCKAVYPNITLADLVSPKIIVVHQRI